MAASVTPTTSAHMGTWTIEVTQTTTYGDDPVWDGVVITVGCTIATITADPAPTSDLTYSLYDGPKVIDLSTWVYHQTPPCDYTVVNSYSWTIPTDAQSFIQDNIPTNYQAITVQSAKKTAVNDYVVVLHNAITDNNEAPSQSFNVDITFTVSVIDPCDTTTMTPINLSAQTIVNGDTYTWTFDEAVL